MVHAETLAHNLGFDPMNFHPMIDGFVHLPQSFHRDLSYERLYPHGDTSPRF